jgi:hypothetical protein
MSPHFYYLSCDQSSFYKPPFRISISLWPSGPFLHSALNSIISSGSDQGLDKTMAEKVCAWMDVEILIYFLLLLFLVSIYLLFSPFVWVFILFMRWSLFLALRTSSSFSLSLLINILPCQKVFQSFQYSSWLRNFVLVFMCSYCRKSQ